MTWKVRGVWKADGLDAEMIVDAPSQRAAEYTASTRGLLVEEAIPESLITPATVSNDRSRQCPSCGSPQTMKASVAHEQGSVSGSISGATLGGDGLGVFGGSTSQRSAFAKRCAPPSDTSGVAGGLLLLFGLFVCISSTPVGVSLMAIGVVTVIVSNNNSDHPRRIAAWNKSWICLQCGEKFLRE